LITIIEKHQIYYLHPEDIIYIRKGQMPNYLRKHYVEVHLKTEDDILEIDNIEVKELHHLISSGKHIEIKKHFRRV
jgi:hypothetical protein